MTNTNYKEISNYNIQISNKIKTRLFGILNFGHCNLFAICLLSFGFLKKMKPLCPLCLRGLIALIFPLEIITS